MDATRPLSEIVDNRRWRRRLKPFPHFVVPNLFVPSVAEEIEKAARKIIDGEGMDVIARYDASGWGFPSDIDWPLRLFVTEEWCDLVSRAVGVDTVPYVSAGLHHHDVGGENGRPHNDLNPVYFADVDPRDGMVSLRGDLVDLKSGRRLQENMPVIRHVRAVSILYYTANPPWHRGDGGQTGLYERRSDRTDQPAATVAPVNNTLLAFECTPNSFHSFISNRVSERNSVTMWLYRSDRAAVTRWGEGTLERWQESPPPAEAVET
ncbi:MAG TPA: 2OG-Fe(II) oxygenase family protein [Acidimicrobiales bacterium]|nr:2OG-Fe(II) oxygenase family protein [Acidimicrobiales bacterium]